MERRSYTSKMLSRSTMVVSVLIFGCVLCGAQIEAKPNGDVHISKLIVPSYPLTAKIARVQGEVLVNLTIGTRGQIESATSTGPGLLKPVALDSARQSVFVCEDCTDSTKPISLTYRFEIVDGEAPKTFAECRASPVPPPAEVDLSRMSVTVYAEPIWLCDPVVRKIRSAKCLYLWRCGAREETD